MDALNGEPPSPSMDVYSFAILRYEFATGKSAGDQTLSPMKLMLAISNGNIPKVPTALAPALSEAKAGWQKDPAARPTVKENCVRLGEVWWNRFLGADEVGMAKAELTLPVNEVVSPATMKLKGDRLEKGTVSLENEVARLKRRGAAADGFEPEAKQLKGEKAGLKSENEGVKGHNAGLRPQRQRVRELAELISIGGT
jgi:hypothetical protein